MFQGVKFMYDCVTGKQIEGSHGCIMADEMVRHSYSCATERTNQSLFLLRQFLMQKTLYVTTI